MNKQVVMVCAAVLAVAGCNTTGPVAVSAGSPEKLTVAEAKAQLDEARKVYREALKASGIKHPERKPLLKAKAPVALTSAQKLEVMTKKQEAFFKNRRIARTRDVETIPGSVITYYERNGAPDGVTTNVLHDVTGTAQNNAVQEALKQKSEELNAMWDEYLTIYGEVYGSGN